MNNVKKYSVILGVALVAVWMSNNVAAVRSVVGPKTA